MISISRIDERLIHGQIVTTWVSAAKATCIVIADDEVAANPFLKQMNISLAPRGTKVEVLSVKDAIDYLLVAQDSNGRELLLVKTPAVILKLVEAGVRIPDLVVGNIGNTGGRFGRTRIVPTVNVSAAEIADFKKLNELGVKITLQTVPDKAARDFMSLLK